MLIHLLNFFHYHLSDMQTIREYPLREIKILFQESIWFAALHRNRNQIKAMDEISKFH